MTEDDETVEKSIYIACNVKNLRIDEFRSLKFDAIKPKLFDNELPGKINVCLFLPNNSSTIL